ncbi:hypothetical protein ABIB80_004901 [Bradyrhizobium sp. i1.15.2]
MKAKPWIIACQRRPNISATAPATNGPAPIHRKPMMAPNSRVEAGVAGSMKYQASASKRRT